MNDDLAHGIDFDFHLDELTPADDDSAELAERFYPDDLSVLAHHHTAPHGSHSFAIAHDRSLTWGIPGEPQVVAIAVVRDLSQSTFTMEKSRHAAVPFAQNWLVQRGCPPEHIALGDGFAQPADDLTLRMEQQIRVSGTRYEVLDTYTSDSEPCEAWVLARDSRASEAPIRVFLQEWDLDAGTYTMREGAFTDAGTAQSWLDDRSAPMPEPPASGADTAAVDRARVALARSTGAATIPNVDLETPYAPPTGPLPRPVQGRLL
ncbi:glycosyl hydrolase [Streptomyces sp. NPDC002533]